MLTSVRARCLRRFIRLAGGDSAICVSPHPTPPPPIAVFAQLIAMLAQNQEYNQEACRLNAFDGKKSLIRSFPSKVGVRRCCDCSNPLPPRMSIGGR